jgi:hypothetical protein
VDAPWWFGDDEDVPPFLVASVEPTGLQVYGVPPEADRRAWDERFRETVGGLPGRALEERGASCSPMSRIGDPGSEQLQMPGDRVDALGEVGADGAAGRRWDAVEFGPPRIDA